MSSVRDNFFCGGVGLLMTFAVAIVYCASVMSRLIVVADSTEVEIADLCSSLIVLALEVGSVTDMAEVGVKIVADSSQQQIKDVTSDADAYHLSLTQSARLRKIYHQSCYLPNDKQQSRYQ